MKGRIFKCPCPEHGDTDFYICNNCWEFGAKRLLEKTIEELKVAGLPTNFEITEGSITYCRVCKMSNKELN